MYPTVSDMERYEAQWGMQPRATPARSASAPAPISGVYPTETAVQPVANNTRAVTTSAPAPVPVETIQPAAPAVPSTPPPAIPPTLR